MKPIENIENIDRVKHDIETYGEKELKYWKKYDFFELSDGLKIFLSGSRASAINNVIYRSDEDAQGHYITSDDIAPTEEDLKRIFIADNMRNLREYSEYLEQRPFAKLYVGKPTYRDSELRNLLVRDDHEVEMWHDVERVLTEAELSDVKKWEEEQRKAHRERLEKYWKRYKNKVYIHTYWANR